MAQQYKMLHDILKKLIHKIEANHDSGWDWNANSQTEPSQTKPLPDQELLFPDTMHINRNTELCICVEGNAYLQLNDRMAVLEPGQFFVITTGTVHRECAPKNLPCTNLWMNIRVGNGIGVAVTGQNEDGEFGLLYDKTVPVSSATKKILTETVNRELSDDRFGAAILIKNRILEVLIEMVRLIDAEDRGQFKHQWQEILVSEAMDYLHRHGAERAELQDVAAHLCISEKQLNRIFKTATGTTVINYFNEQRLAQAKYYLTATNVKLEEIAELLNYYDQYHFSRMFKKATGFTPSQYRKLRREE